jgi:hypothetical protein
VPDVVMRAVLHQWKRPTPNSAGIPISPQLLR